MLQKYPGLFRPGKIIASNLDHFKSVSEGLARDLRSLSFQVDYGDFVLRDSYLLLNSGLDNLVKSLKGRADGKSNVWDCFPSTKALLDTHYSHCDPQHFPLLLGKGIFPYEFFTDLDVLDNATLPPQSAFYSRLTGSGITREAHEHANKVGQVDSSCATTSRVLVGMAILSVPNTERLHRTLCAM